MPAVTAGQTRRINPAATLIECNRHGGAESRQRGYAMRLAFRRAGKEETVVRASRSLPAPVSPVARVASQFGDLDLRSVGRALQRKRGWIIVPTVIAAALSITAVNMIAPRYKSEARLLIDGRESVFLRPNGERNEERSALDPEAVTSQVQLLLSRDLAREIIKKNRLGAAGIRPGPAGDIAPEVGTRSCGDRARPVFADAGRAGA
jgi:hypothetical protein